MLRQWVQTPRGRVQLDNLSGYLDALSKLTRCAHSSPLRVPTDATHGAATFTRLQVGFITPRATRKILDFRSVCHLSSMHRVVDRDALSSLHKQQQSHRSLLAGEGITGIRADKAE